MFIFFQADKVTNPAIWLVLSAVRISDHGHSNACVNFFREFFFVRLRAWKKINVIWRGSRSQFFTIGTSQPANNIYLPSAVFIAQRPVGPGKQLEQLIQIEHNTVKTGRKQTSVADRLLFRILIKKCLNGKQLPVFMWRSHILLRTVYTLFLTQRTLIVS